MTLPLSSIADVVYDLPPVASPRQGFDLGLIVGASDVISAVDRVVVYSSLAEMVTDGFTTSSPEYLAAQVYFAADSAPTQVAIGVQESGETALQALQACRTANTDWYIAYVITADNTDHADIAAWMETLDNPYSMYFLQTTDSAVLNDSGGNLFETLNTAAYDRTLGLYSADDYAIASVMGYAMGATNDTSNSAYTLKFKTLPNITADDLTTQQVTNIQSNKGNVYITRGANSFLENGSVFSGSWFDEIIYLDKLTNEIQLNVADLLASTKKVPQTEEGMAQIKNVITQACDKLVKIGFIAPGEWSGGALLSLANGDYLPEGYVILSEPLADQEQADRDARIAPPIYVAIKLAGAIHSVVIRVNVNR